MYRIGWFLFPAGSFWRSGILGFCLLCNFTHTHDVFPMSNRGSGRCFEEQRYINTESRWAVRQLGGGEGENSGRLGHLLDFFFASKSGHRTAGSLAPFLGEGGDPLGESSFVYLSARLGRWTARGRRGGEGWHWVRGVKPRGCWTLEAAGGDGEPSLKRLSSSRERGRGGYRTSLRWSSSIVGEKK